jgi:hypothetical protein
LSIPFSGKGVMKKERMKLVEFVSIYHFELREGERGQLL